MQFATGLSELNLDFNDISDLTPLAGLDTLSILILSRNDIPDLTPCQTCPRLQTRMSDPTTFRT